MLFSDITYLNENFEPVEHGYVRVEGCKITEAGNDKIFCRAGEEEYNGQGKLLIPAFVNAHCHVAMTLLRGYGEGLSLHRWLHEKVFPYEANLNDEAVYYGTMVGIAEMIRSGAVSFSDMYFHCDQTIRAALEAGVNLNICKGVTCFGEDFTGSTDEAVSRRLYTEFHGKNDGQIRVELCVHAEYTNGERAVAQVAALAKELGAGIQIHLSETASEHEECIARHGITPAAFMQKHGVFDHPVTAAHCVHIDAADIELLREYGVSPVYCPSSNLKLGSGFAPVSEMLQAGLNLTIGTDGASSNNNLNMLQEVQLAALVEKGRKQDAAALSNRKILQMATIHGAKAQGRASTGRIFPGCDADLVVIDFTSPQMQPCYDKVANLLYAADAQDVALTMCRGKILYENGTFQTIDLPHVQKEMTRLAYEIAQKTQTSGR